MEACGTALGPAGAADLGEVAMTGTAATAEPVARFERLIAVGIALSSERDHDRLMERILLEAKGLSNADGGTLYLKTEDERLRFEIMRTDSLGIAMGGTTGKAIPFPPLALFDAEGAPNHKNVATHVALTGATIEIPDAYTAADFDFSGTRKFDEGTGYRSKSFLTVPLKNHEGDVIGVLQLLNARHPESGAVVPFGGDVRPLIEALASQAAVALDNRQLIDAQRRLIDSFITLIAKAIDAKSPYTGGHCQRVPELTQMLAKAACESDAAPFTDFALTEEEWYELHIASWLHDCGKVTTPEYVVDKATKLETIYNRLHEIRTRFEIIKRDAEIDYLKAVAAGGDEAALKAERDRKLAEIDADFAFIAECNIGGEFMAEDRIERVKRIAGITWWRTLDDRLGLSVAELRRLSSIPARPLPAEEPLLADRPEHIVPREPGDTLPSDNPHGFKIDRPENKYNFGEVYNLCVARGTLTAEERYKINDHIVQTIVMLGELPFPKNLSRVPEYAGGHHETMIGTGYPKGLRREEMSLPARAMAIADIFEALTASDRPYKKAKSLSESLDIMASMRDAQHIDPDLFALFLTSGAYRKYAETHLKPEQIDEVDIAPLLAGKA
ncbi:MAG: GAF domain-containing protein [Rhodospirillales bacterium]|nr:GAF domain-containing protein [Rhodospirillales bacterium]